MSLRELLNKRNEERKPKEIVFEPNPGTPWPTVAEKPFQLQVVGKKIRWSTWDEGAYILVTSCDEIAVIGDVYANGLLYLQDWSGSTGNGFQEDSVGLCWEWYEGDE